jgi:hypothetical protein
VGKKRKDHFPQGNQESFLKECHLSKNMNEARRKSDIKQALRGFQAGKYPV